MSELIKREDAIKATWHEPSYTDAYNVLTEVRDRIEALPTVDAVPVVRCKDCKHCYAEGFVNVRNVCEKHYDFCNVDDDWFCADGERRTDGNTAENE